MASGLKPNDKCVSVYQELKLGHKWKYILYEVSSEEGAIVPTKTRDSKSPEMQGDDEEKKYEVFLQDLKADNACRWAVYDFEYELEGGKRSKLVLISWAAPDARIKQRMVFASSKEALRNALVGIATEIQGSDHDEVSYQAVLEKVKGRT